MTDPAQPDSADPTNARLDQNGQTVQGPQTNIAGDANAPILSGTFYGPVNLGDVTAPPAAPARPKPWGWLSVGALVVIAMLGLWGLTNGNSRAGASPSTTVSVATLTPSPTHTIAPIPTATPDLQVLTSVNLQNHRLYDVVAANGHVWFATDKGLFYYQSGQVAEPQPIASVPYPLSALAVETSGTTVWFSRSDAGEIAPGDGLIGRYLVGEDHIDWFPPPPYNDVAFKDITSIQVGRAGEVWFGNFYGVVAQLTFDDSGSAPRWEFQSMPTELPPVLHVYDIAVDPADRSVVWLAGTSAVYRWRDKRWNVIDRKKTSGSIETDTVNAIAIDADSRVWFVSTAGVMLYADRQPSGLLSVPCPTNPALDAIASADDQSIWLVTQSELRRMDISQPESLDQCDTWVWSQWPDSNLWAGTDGSDYRLAVDVDASGAMTIWVIQRGTDKVRFVRWRP